MTILDLNQHFATPGLKLLYDQRDQKSPVGIFVRCNLITIQRARKEILYKALIAQSLYKVCPNMDVVNMICSTITHDEIPQNDEQSSALMKMLPGKRRP